MHNILRRFLAGIMLVLFVNSCRKESVSYETVQYDSASCEEEYADAYEKKKETVFGTVPYFRDDTGQDAQFVKGFLYGYWNGRLCRYDVENNYKEEILFDAGCNQSGSFCICEGVIYFLTRPVVSTISNENTCLYKINCDGSEQVLLMEGIPDVIHCGNYEIDIYEDIVYLWDDSYYDANVLCYRLIEDEVECVPIEYTLYGKIPEGYSEIRADRMPTLVYMIRNYGYALLEKEEEWYAYDFETETLEKLAMNVSDIQKDSAFMTQEAIYFQDYSRNSYAVQWYYLSLEDLQTPRKWIVHKRLGGYDRVFYDEDTVCFVEWNGAYDRWIIYRARQEDTTAEILSSFNKREGLGEASAVFCGGNDLWYFDGDAMYYNEDGKYCDVNKAGMDCIIRDTLIGEEQIICVYNELAEYGKQLCYTIEEEIEYKLPKGLITGEGVYEEVTFSLNLKKTFMRGDSEAVQKINAYMQSIYEKQEEDMQYYGDKWEDAGMEEPLKAGSNAYYALVGLAGSYAEFYAYVDYADEQYIVFCVLEGGYWSGAAHPNYHYTHYIFDRSTGERLSICDIIKKSEEEICSIIAPYIDKDYDFDEGFWQIEPELVLNPDRLFLTSEGVGIFFSRYEIDCYAAGEIEFVIPYEAFE